MKSELHPFIFFGSSSSGLHGAGVYPSCQSERQDTPSREKARQPLTFIPMADLALPISLTYLLIVVGQPEYPEWTG